VQNSDFGPLISPDIEPLFWTPERLGRLSAWWGHVPFAFWIIANSEPRSFVELGTHYGVSYAAFCEAVLRLRLTTRCYAIDSWVGDPQAGPYGEDVYAELRGFNNQHYAAFSQLVRRTFDEANGDFADGTIDLLHIDGFHTYDAVRHDFETWRPKLSDRGVVLFHDTNERQRDFGVWRLFEELKREAPTFEFLHGHGLGIVALGADQPSAIRQLCALTDRTHIGAIRERFSFLGSRWIAAREKSELEEAQRPREELARAREELALAQAGAHARQLEAEIAQREAHALAREEVIAQAGAHARQLEAEIAQKDIRVPALEDALKIKEGESQRLERDLEQSRQAYGALTDASRQSREDVLRELAGLKRDDPEERLPRELTGWGWIPSGRRKKLRRLIKEYRLITASPLFDSQWYLANNLDVALKFEDAALHYLLHGGREGRAPGPRFDGGAYLQANPDVAYSQSNPLLHYIRQGHKENRRIMRVENGPSQTNTDIDPHASIGSKPSNSGFAVSGNGLDLSTSPAPPSIGAKVEAKAMTARRLSTLTLFVRHGAKKYRNALSELDSFYLKNIPEVTRTLIVVDNIENESFIKERSEDLTIIGGDNEYWEFSSWDSALKFVGPRLMTFDYVHLVTSAFGELYTKYIHLIDERMLLSLQGRPVALGHIDAYNTPIRLLGRVSQSWIRSSFVFVPPTVLRLLGPLVSFRNPSLFFTGNAKRPFLPDAPLCSEYQANILNWITGPGTGQGTEWHSRFDLTDETISLFEAKALAILNEHALSIRLRAFGATTVDVTWLANCLRQHDQDSLRAMRLPHWREQLEARKPYL
jgi:Methyltransferase domain